MPIDFVFPTHEVMGTLRPIDKYVVKLITALRKAFKIAHNMTQTEALRQSGDMTINPQQLHYTRGMLYW